MGGSKIVGMKTEKERQKKVVLMYQVYLCEFQRVFKFGTEEKTAAVEIEKTLCGGNKYIYFN